MRPIAQQLQAVESVIESVKKALIHDHISHSLERSFKASGSKGRGRCGISGQSRNICDV